MAKLYLLLICFCVFSCLDTEKESTPDIQADHSLTAKQEIINAEQAMSKMAVEEGFGKSLLAFAADSMIKPENGRHPVIGKKALEEYFAKGEDTKAVSWVPTHAEAAKSGDLGYTFGNWKLENPDTSIYGNYFTAWKKQPDGTWKWTIDGGNNTPPPE